MEATYQLSFELLSLWLVVFFASLVQGATGFGLAMIITPLLVQSLGVSNTTPLIGLFTITIGIIFLINYRHAMEWKAITQLTLPACIATPAGVYLLTMVPERALTTGLGLFIIAYAVYALRTPNLPTLQAARWAYLFGFISGILTGAYAIGGPPVIVYGSARRWEINTFKSNLQAYFMLTGIFLLGTLAVNGDLTTEVWRYYLLSLPVLLLGLATGLYTDRFLKGERFRHRVLYLILILGTRLLFL